MIQPRRALSVVTLADGIYAIGGFDGQNYLNSVEKYDEFSNSWTMICSMVHARCTHHAVAVFETQEIYVFGGFDYSPLSSVERYSVVTDTWEDVGSMPVPRFMHGCVYMRE
jgi:influenza virus NS1A-binding protein